jgi:hypothetical protein
VTVLVASSKRAVTVLVPGYQSDMRGFQDKLSDSHMWAVLSYIERRSGPIYPGTANEDARWSVAGTLLDDSSSP